jgi:hypothetical protein
MGTLIAIGVGCTLGLGRGQRLILSADVPQTISRCGTSPRPVRPR